MGQTPCSFRRLDMRGLLGWAISCGLRDLSQVLSSPWARLASPRAQTNPESDVNTSRSLYS